MAQKISSTKMKASELSAICPRCAESGKTVWLAATRDASKVIFVLSSIAAQKLKKAQVVKLAKEYDMEDMTAELVQYAAGFHEKACCDMGRFRARTQADIRG